MRFRLLAAFTIAVHAHPGVTHGQQSTPDSVRVQRLMAVGRLWGIVSYFHPAFLYRNVPWDSAVAAAIPRIRAAQDRVEYASAVDALLGVLGDRNTRVQEPKPAPVADDPALRHGTTLSTQWERDSTLVVRIPCCFQEQYRELQQAATLIERAHRVIVDLRGPPPGIRGEADDEFAARIVALLTQGDIAFPTTRRRIYHRFGENRTTDRTGGVYRGRSDNLPRTTAFLVYADSDLPSVAWALRRASQGYVVLDDARGSRLLPDPALSDPPLFPLDLGEGLTAEVRVVDMLGEPNGLLDPDTVITKSGTADGPLDAALALVRRSRAARARQASEGTVLPQREDVYPATRFPDVGYRILAGFKYWNAVHYFYPSAMPPGTSWDHVLGESVRSLEHARDTLDYWLAIAAMTSRLADGHAAAGAPIAPHVTGRAGPRLLVGYIEGHVVVTRVMPDSATASSGIRVGDVILRVDGEQVESRMARIQKVMPGTSRPGEPNGPPLNQLLFGNPGTVARLTVDRGDGVVRDVSMPRVMPPCLPQSCAERDGPAIRFLAPDIGYADLYSITESMVDSVFETFKRTRAIVFDGRGRNAGAPPAIAARLAGSRFVAGRSKRPLILSPDFNVRATSESRLFLQGKAEGRYGGQTVLLINDRAFSNAEQVALFFAGANGTTLIGSPTAGGIGGITPVPLPGGIAPTFPGGETVLSDGRPMIRIGIPPDIFVRPTIAGVRARRDEVLERALAFLSNR